MLVQDSRRHSGSSDDVIETARKRKRKTLSCVQCQRRKLKCDRLYPCARCLKSGHADACTYDSTRPVSATEERPSELGGDTGATLAAAPEAASMYMNHGSPEATIEQDSNDVASKVSSQAEKIAQLEQRLASLENIAPPPTHTQAPTPTMSYLGESASNSGQTENQKIESMEPETMIFRGFAFKTFFEGASSPSSLFAHFPGLRSFIVDAVTNYSALSDVRGQMKMLQNKQKAEKVIITNMDAGTLRSMLPERDTVDSLVQLYFDTFETTYRILHMPTFRKNYHNFWEDPLKTSPGFVATLLLVIATVRCLNPPTPYTYIGPGSSARETAVGWIEASEFWLHQQSQKHLTMTHFQIQCLLLLAKLVTSFKEKRIWTSAGTLMRFGMAAGLHRDPSLLGGKTSVFDQEMRRRLWATMVELELQASFDKGMPSATAGHPFDCKSPLNVHDEELTESSPQLPASWPEQEYTATSFLYISQKSLALRTSLNSMINDGNSNITYAQFSAYNRQIMQQLESIPRWVDTQMFPKTGLPFSALPQILLDIQLRQYLLLLHSPYARRAGPNLQYGISRTVCFDTACTILLLHSKLIASGNFALCLLRWDIYRAALNICQVVFTSTLIRDEVFIEKHAPSFPALIKQALQMLEIQIMRIGRGQKYYWFAAAANGLATSKTSPGDTVDRKHQAITNVVRIYYELLAAQEGAVTLQTQRPTLVSDGITNLVEARNLQGPTDTTEDVFRTTGQAETAPPEIFNFNDFFPWNIDDLWAYNPNNI